MIHFTRRTWESTTNLCDLSDPNTKSRIFKTLKIGLWYQGSYIAVGTPQRLGDFFHLFLELTFGGRFTETFGGQLQGPFMNQHIADVTSFWSRVLGWLIKAQEMLEMLETSLGDVTAKWALFFFGC